MAVKRGCSVLAGCGVVEPYKAGRQVEPCGKVSLETNNTGMFARWAAEHTCAAGTEIEYWWQDLEACTLDPLYNEPTARVWQGPFTMRAILTWPEQSVEVREEGIRYQWQGEVWIPRLMIEMAGLPGRPKEGDVVRVWDIPFFEQAAQGVERNIPHAGYFFDLVRGTEDGHLFDTADFTGFKYGLSRRTEFTPERRLYNET